jgi:hypothetical protein
MADLYGRKITRQQLLSLVGDLSQVAGVTLGELKEGVESGVRTAEFRSGSGLRFTVLLDRGLDIGPAEYRGIPLAWISPTGFAHPARFEPEGLGWLRSFGGGLLTGCGLTYLGSPEVDEGEALGLHGRLSNLPAQKVQVGEQWQGDECTFWLEGRLRQARVFGENLSLTRRISVGLGESRIVIQDTVENLSDRPSPLMVLYHINLGFPMVDGDCLLEAEEHPVQPRDRQAEGGWPVWMNFREPAPDYDEQVFYHDLPADQAGWVRMTLNNSNLGLKLTVLHKKDTLPNLVQWKMMGSGEYVLGLEPANCLVEGRNKERRRGTLQTLQPGEQRQFNLEILVEGLSDPLNP